jgi:hypothetical protein
MYLNCAHVLRFGSIRVDFVLYTVLTTLAHQAGRNAEEVIK